MTLAGHLLLAAPVLAVTCWAELRVIPPAIRTVEPFYALLAQLIGWSAVVVAVAASVARSRFAYLGGAIAAPIAFAIIALVWYTPQTAKFLVQPPAIPHSVAVGWYAITAAALIVTCATMRDHWHRYARIFTGCPFLSGTTLELVFQPSARGIRSLVKIRSPGAAG